jgi:hypothetical protein
MDLFVLLINKGVGVFCIQVSPLGFSLLYEAFLHKCSLVCSSYQSGRECLLYTGLALLLQARDFLFCTTRSSTNVPWFVLLINQSVSVYCIGLAFRGGFSLLYVAVLHKCSMVCSAYQSRRGCLLYRSRFPFTRGGLTFCTKRSSTDVYW